MLVFACISPHAPIFLPDVGSLEDRQKVKQTIQALEKLGEQLAQAKPDQIIITSPHQDWGINVPANFLLANLQFSIYNLQSISNFKFSNLDFNNATKLRYIRTLFCYENSKLKIKNSTLVLPILTTLDSPQQHFEYGRQIIRQVPAKTRIGWIASGDMSHRLKEDGPYGLHPSGPKFDQKFIELLKAKNVSGILDLDSNLIEEAGECGLRSFCMLLGAIEGNKISWTPEILSYEGPFGVGYLVARLV